MWIPQCLLQALVMWDSETSEAKHGFYEYSDSQWTYLPRTYPILSWTYASFQHSYQLVARSFATYPDPSKRRNIFLLLVFPYFQYKPFPVNFLCFHRPWCCLGDTNVPYLSFLPFFFIHMRQINAMQYAIKDINHVEWLHTALLPTTSVKCCCRHH